MGKPRVTVAPKLAPPRDTVRIVFWVKPSLKNACWMAAERAGLRPNEWIRSRLARMAGMELGEFVKGLDDGEIHLANGSTIKAEKSPVDPVRGESPYKEEDA